MTLATPGPTPPRWPSSRTVVAAVVLAGVALRVLEYLAGRSLWIDEAVVAVTVGTDSPGGLLSTPHRFVFLLAEWIATRLGGMNELALRALPLAAGIAFLAVFARLASRLLEVHVVWFAVALAALSPALVYYANEAKPYGIDALVTVLLLGCALDVLDTAGSRLAWRRLVLAGAVALLVSIPAAFVLAGIGLALATAPQLRGRPEAVWRLALAGALWVVGLAALYVALYRSTAADPYMQTWWAGGFLTPQSPEFPHRTWMAAQTVMGEFFVGGRPEPAAVVLAGMLFVAGLLAIARRRGRTTALILAGPIVAAVAASAAQRYPVAPRTMLFAAPIAIVALGAGVAWLVDRIPAPGRMVALGLAAVLWLTPALGANLDRITRPQLPEAPRAAIEEFNRRQRSDEPVYVFGQGVPAWLFYTTDWAAPDTTRLRQVTQWWGSPRPMFANSPRHVEGREAVYPYRGRRELIGITTGMEWRLATGYARDAPEPGWADNEAARIQVAAQPYIWLFLSHFASAERAALLDAVQRGGGHAVYGFEAAQAELYRYRFVGGTTMRRSEP